MTAKHFFGRAAATTLVLGQIATASLAETFSLTGQYEGRYACDSTTGGVPASWSDPMRAGIVQDGDDISIDLLYTDKQELGAEYSLYSGSIALSPDGTLISGYFEACGGTFPSKELARFFPASTSSAPFSLSVTSVWASDQVPNIPGLTVQTCIWSLTRVSTDTPKIRSCDTNSQ
ncbi:hypothetical protein [Ruegeria sp. Ofav3-42]|uniref:hypothetical protein n=1 Tax=Ruegeria sp. Ofav3-42 TaxID=2917759 RepID=UPI001EF456AF|nr:hypothetical protein [Ruegeria sp. Ofav3-42]MCG7521399.1 hypothetical protein [Ruegeria sp. Ofav3-42]